MSNLATITNNILADSGIDDINVVVTTGSYSNPSWITALSWTKITDRPTTLAGYGITDAVPSSRTITINGTAQDLSDNRIFNVGTVTSVAALTLGTSGTDLSSTVANSTTTPVITLNVPTASATNRGALSAADWTTFNNKQNALTNPVTGTGTTNYLPKFTGTSTIGNSVISESGTIITVAGSSRFTGFDSGYYNENVLAIGNGTNNPKIGLASTSGYRWNTRIKDVGGNGEYVIRYEEGSLDALIINRSGNLGLGVTPSAWANPFKVIEGGGSGFQQFIGFQNNDNSLKLGVNHYYNGSAYVYTNNGLASRLDINADKFIFNTAPSGTAGNAISFTQAMTLDASGNLGIGIPNPSNRLQITAAAGSSHARWTESATTVGFVGGAQGIITGHNGKFAVRAESGLVLSGSGNSADVVIASGGAATFSSSVTAGGLLSVNGDATLVGNFNYSSNGTYVRWQNNGTSFGDIGSAGSLVSGGATNDFAIHARSTFNMVFSTNFTERMRITSSGNVGIGATSPTDLLTLQRNDGRIRFNTTSGTRILLIGDDFGSGGFQQIYDASGAVKVTFSAGVSYFNGGNVGIGTISPIEKLHVNGNIYVASGDVYGATSYSDAAVNKGMSFSGSNLLFNNGGERMRITSGGNVLIGTATPNGARLQVNGTNPAFDIQNAGSTYFRAELDGSNFTYLSTFGANDMILRTNATARLTLNGSTGAATFSSSVGIGGSPVLRLDVQGNASDTTTVSGVTVEQVSLFRPSNGVGGIRSGFNTSTGDAYLWSAQSGSSLNFGTRSAPNNTAHLSITSGGNVLIGTATDNGYRLNVSGISSSTTGFLLSSGQYTSISGVPYIGMFATEAASSDGFGALLISSRTDVARPIIFGTSNGSVSTERMRITSSGNVGIGTPSPSSRLQSNNSSTFNSSTPTGAIIASNLSANNAIVDIGVDSSVLGYIQSRNVSNTTTYNLLLNPLGGNVLIGTTTSVNHRMVVASNADANAICLVGRSSDNGSSLDFFGNNSSTFLMEMRVDSLSADFNYQLDAPMIFYTNTLPRMRITGGGNVLINTTDNPGATLHVGGTIRTGAPSGGSAVNWRLGTARGGTVTSNATVRVEIDGALVDLVARYV